MTLSVPLSVRLVTTRADRHITGDLHDLSFRSTIPGGFASATMSLDRPLILQPDEIAYYGRVIIYDERNGRTVWEGRLEDPGRGVGAQGQIWELAAVGPSAHASDRTVPLIYVDRDLTNWYYSRLGSTVHASAARRENIEYSIDDTIEALLLGFNDGIPITTNSVIMLRYARLREFGQLLGRFDFRHVEGRTHASFLVRAVTRPGGSLVRDNTFSTTESTADPQVMTTDFSASDDMVELRIQWTGATGTEFTTDISWSEIGGLYIQAQRYDKTGTVVGASGYTAYSVLASQIVADLLGRLLTEYDGDNATVETTTYAIDHLAYPDAATPAKILEDLMLLEPGFYWATWERNLVTDKHRFEWMAWSGEIRYEADILDGYSSTGSATELFNAATVRWRDGRGWTRTTRRTQTVPELAAAGLTRDTFIDLGDDLASPLNAQRAGDQILTEHATPPNAGILTIARPIHDHHGHKTVQPWEIRPGHLIRVQGVLPRRDSLNATTRDGVTVFKVVGVDYSASSAAATLELDAHSPTVARRLAQVAAQKRRR